MTLPGNIRLTAAIAALLVTLVAAFALMLPADAAAAAAAGPEAAAAAGEGKDGQVAPLITLAIYLGLLSLLPFAVMTLTSFLRIVIVLGFLRSGLGAQSIPPNVVIIGLSLFLTLFVMGPTLDKIMADAVPAAQEGRTEEATTAATGALKEFMVKQLGKNAESEFATFYGLAHKEAESEDIQAVYSELQDGNMEAVGMRELIPTFMVSELKKAFIMGFAVLLPFLVIDMVIANVLLSLGMFMLPPVVVSLPFKVLLFVLAGGWGLVVEFLVAGFVT